MATTATRLSRLSFPHVKPNYLLTHNQLVAGAEYNFVNRAILDAFNDRRLVITPRHRNSYLSTVPVSFEEPATVTDAGAYAAQVGLSGLDAYDFLRLGKALSVGTAGPDCFVSPAFGWWSNTVYRNGRLHKAIGYVGPYHMGGWALSFQWAEFLWPAGTVFVFAPGQT